ncbi:MAG: LysR family transcriptional regulator [Proteobacteria bacterium]|nr:LysR family transcriptional regulator [Pseudomonadota bacterium]
MNSTPIAVRDTQGPAEPDWALLRAFLQVVHSGSLSAAAAALGSSQPTLSRQLARLEAHVGSALFERTRRGLVLTEAGAALRAPAERMRAHAMDFALRAAGRTQSLAGTVRLTASEVMSAFVLPGLLRELRDACPEIEVEMVASDDVENLLEREADIALRMVRPRQSALIARRLPDQPLGLYAHRDYIAARGRPTRANLLQHEWVGYDRSDQMLRGFRAAGMKVSRSLFGLRCDSQIVVWQAVSAGLGIGVGMERVAAQTPDVVRVLRDVEVPPLPLWITAHRELRGTPRIQCVFDALARALGGAA